MVHIGEAHRSDHGGHSALASPVGSGIKQRINHFGVVDKIHKTETKIGLAGALVYHAVDYRSDTAHGAAVAVGHERLRLAEVEGGIFRGRESIDIVHHQRRHEIRVVAVKVDAEFNGFSQLRAGRLYGSDLNGHFCMKS